MACSKAGWILVDAGFTDDPGKRPTVARAAAQVKLLRHLHPVIVSIRAAPTAAVAEVAEAVEEILHRLDHESRHQYVRSEIMAMGYAAVGDLDRAFACLERAFRGRSAGLIYLHVDPGYKPVRGDQRFRRLVERIGLRSVTKNRTAARSPYLLGGGSPTNPEVRDADQGSERQVVHPDGGLPQVTPA